MTRRLMTAPEVAEYLNIGTSTAYGLMSKKRDGFPSVKIGGAIRVREDDLEQWIDEQTQRTS